MMNTEESPAHLVVNQALTNTVNTTGPARLARTSGSYIEQLRGDETGYETERFLRGLWYAEVTEKEAEKGNTIPGCRYFKAQIPAEYSGKLAALTVDQVAKRDIGITFDEWDRLPQGEVRDSYKIRLQGLCDSIGHMVMGEHSCEFQFDVDPEPVDYLMLITGPAGDGDERQVVWTWHPGPIMGKPVRAKDLVLHGTPLPF